MTTDENSTETVGAARSAEPEAPGTPQRPTDGRRGRRWLLPTIAVVVVVLAVAAVLSYFFVFRDDDAKDEPNGQKEQVETSTVEPFADLGVEDPGLPPARASVIYGLFEPGDDGRFRPADPVGRADFARLVVVVFALESAVPDSPTFSDVPPAHEDYLAVETAGPYFAQVAGSDEDPGAFRPNDPVSADEARQLIELLLQESAPDQAETLGPELAESDAASGDGPLTRLDAARLLVLLIEGMQSPAADEFEAIGVN